MKIKDIFLKIHIFMNFTILKKEKIRRLLLIGIISKAEEDNYSTSVGSCINGFTVRYYPFIREKQQLTQQELVGYHQQVEQLVQSFVNNSSKK